MKTIKGELDGPWHDFPVPDCWKDLNPKHMNYLIKRMLHAEMLIEKVIEYHKYDIEFEISNVMEDHLGSIVNLSFVEE